MWASALWQEVPKLSEAVRTELVNQLGGDPLCRSVVRRDCPLQSGTCIWDEAVESKGI